MIKRTRFIAIAALGALVFTTGCATKGQLRKGLAAEAAARQTALDQERSERIAGDERLAVDVRALNADLATLRNEFGVRIAQIEQGLEFAVPVHFGFDRAELEGDARPTLDRFVQLVQKHYPGGTITVEGFADPAGSTSYNQQLSRRRAETVRAYLVSAGLTDDQLRAVGYGEDRLVVPNAAGSEQGAELNRRVVFVLETPRVDGLKVTQGTQE
jgi:outer membrane protein OmpA-like peptidoglycan-associated protein